MSRKEQLSPAEKKRRKGRTRLIWKTILLAVLLVILLGMIWLASGGMEKLEQMGPPLPRRSPMYFSILWWWIRRGALRTRRIR